MVIVLLANGFEEIEALSPVDVLRREDINVKTVGLNGKTVTGAHEITVMCDALPEEINLEEVEMVVFPGGMPGAANLDAHPFTDKAIDAVIKNGGHMAAICAAPLVLGRRGLLKGKRAVCFPGFEPELKGAVIGTENVVTDGNITTANGMPSALEFAKELAAVLQSMHKKLPTAVLNNISEAFEKAERLSQVFKEASIKAAIKSFDMGPRLIRYHVVPDKGTRISEITSLETEIALSFAKEGVRIEAPIPGKIAVGIQIPLDKPEPVMLSELMSEAEYTDSVLNTRVCIGKDIENKPVIDSVERLTHMLIAGATGMGKTVCISSLLLSMMKKAAPSELKLILIDPKMVEYPLFTDAPHLLTPVIFNTKKAAGALMWAVEEMERRYELIARSGKRNINEYNELCAEDPSVGTKLPRIVIVIDELADLMLQVRDTAENLIMSLAQKARAAGIHLIIGTQRPTDDVITDAIKSNIPSRICFRVATRQDSSRVLDCSGDEKLLGSGDMLFMKPGLTMPLRVQGAYASDDDVFALIEEIKAEHGSAVYDPEIEARMEGAAEIAGDSAMPVEDDNAEPVFTLDMLGDRCFLDSVKLAIDAGGISISKIQRFILVGYARAARYIDAMLELGIIANSGEAGKHTAVMSLEEWNVKLEKLRQAKA